MKTETRHALKQDKFALAAQGGVSWVTEHRSGVLRWVITGVVVLVVIVAALVIWNVRSSAAENALGAALDTYSAPLNQPGTPAQPGAYNTAAERAKAANQQRHACGGGQQQSESAASLPQAARHFLPGGSFKLHYVGVHGSRDSGIEAHRRQR